MHALARILACFYTYKSMEALAEEAFDRVPYKDEKRPSSIRPALELFHRQQWGNILRDRAERIWTFPSA